MRPWNLKVNCRHGRNKVTEINLVGIDPNSSVSAVVVDIIEKQFAQSSIVDDNDGGEKKGRSIGSFVASKKRIKEKRAEMYEEYGLFLPNPPHKRRVRKRESKEGGEGEGADGGVDENGIYLEGTKSFAFYSLNRKKETIELRLKPKYVKIKFVDNTFQQIKLTPYSLIGEIIKHLRNMVLYMLSFSFPFFCFSFSFFGLCFVSFSRSFSFFFFCFFVFSLAFPFLSLFFLFSFPISLSLCLFHFFGFFFSFPCFANTLELVGFVG